MYRPTRTVTPLVVFALGMLVSHVLPAAGRPKGNAAKGKAIYARLGCHGCHGDTGRGDGPGADGLDPRPTDFTDRAVMSKRTDRQLANAIKNGGPAEKLSPSMPGYKDDAKDAEIADVVAYLRSLIPPKKK